MVIHISSSSEGLQISNSTRLSLKVTSNQIGKYNSITCQCEFIVFFRMVIINYIINCYLSAKLVNNKKHFDIYNSNNVHHESILSCRYKGWSQEKVEQVQSVNMIADTFATFHRDDPLDFLLNFERGIRQMFYVEIQWHSVHQ